MVIWTYSPDVIEVKGTHLKKAGGRRSGGWHKDNGDVPVARYNSITKKMEAVVNPRGRAYGLRKAKRYRKKV